MVLRLSRSVRQYVRRMRHHGPLISAMEANLKDSQAWFALPMVYASMPLGWGETRARRGYVALTLNLPGCGNRHLPDRICTLLEIPISANGIWSTDVISMPQGHSAVSGLSMPVMT